MASSVTSLVHFPVASFGPVASGTVATISSAPSAIQSSTPAPFVPANLSSSLQGSFLFSVNAGMYISAVLFGVHTITLGRALIAAWRHKSPKDRAMLITVASVLWAMALVYELCSVVYTVGAWFNGGGGISTYTYFLDNQNATWIISATVAFFVSTVVADGFLYMRCSALWKKVWLTVILGLFTLSTYGLDFVQMFWVAWSTSESLWVIPWNGVFVLPVVLAQSLHITFSILLASHLAVVHTKICGKGIGVKELAIETALAYSAVSVVFLATYCSQNMAANVFLPILVQTQGITIDLMIAHGRGVYTVDDEETGHAIVEGVETPSETNTVNDNEKLALAMVVSTWGHELDREDSEPSPPEYAV